MKSFDLAERFQTPVFMLSDLDIGMNDWVMPKLTWDDGYRPDRGRVLNAEELEISQEIPPLHAGKRQRGRAAHPARRLRKGAFFTRGSGHNKFGGYTEIPDEYQEVMDRLLRKHKEAAGFVPAPIIEKRQGARVGIITLGGCDPAVREAIDILAADRAADGLHAHPRDSRSTSRSRRSSPSMISATSSNRIATRSFVRC